MPTYLVTVEKAPDGKSLLGSTATLITSAEVETFRVANDLACHWRRQFAQNFRHAAACSSPFGWVTAPPKSLCGMTVHRPSFRSGDRRACDAATRCRDDWRGHDAQPFPGPWRCLPSSHRTACAPGSSGSCRLLRACCWIRPHPLVLVDRARLATAASGLRRSGIPATAPAAR